MYTVNPDGPWRLYSPTVPASCTPIGTIRRALGDTGALVRFEDTGLYGQLNAGCMRSLDQAAVQRALAGTTDLPDEGPT